MPLCLLTIPLFDSRAALLRRKLTGRSIFSGDRGTLALPPDRTLREHQAVGIVALGSGACAVAVLASITWRNDMVAVISGGAIIVMFVVSRMFGHSELRLVASRFQSLGDRSSDLTDGRAYKARIRPSTCRATANGITFGSVSRKRPWICRSITSSSMSTRR